MELPKSNLETHFPLWVAFSDLFLDTEITDSDLRYIATVIKESSFSPEEVIEILWLEVFPALCDNLRIVAGEWAGFDEKWLKERVLGVKSGSIAAFSDYGILSVNQVISITEHEWNKLCAYLPNEYVDVKRPHYNRINSTRKSAFSLRRFFWK